MDKLNWLSDVFPKLNLVIIFSNPILDRQADTNPRWVVFPRCPGDQGMDIAIGTG
jgi:hypothetical protein